MTELVLAVLGLGTGVFTASATSKLRGGAAYREYRAGLAATSLVPERLLPATAMTLCIAEVIVALALASAAAVTAAWLPGAIPLAVSALGLAAALSAVLTAGVATVVRRGTTATCACFGARSGRPLTVSHVARNACLLVVLVAGLVVAALAAAKSSPAASVVALAAGLFAALIFVRWDDLAYLLGPVPSNRTTR